MRLNSSLSGYKLSQLRDVFSEKKMNLIGGVSVWNLLFYNSVYIIEKSPMPSSGMTQAESI